VAAGDSEFTGEEAAAEEVLMSKAIAVGSGLERVLDVEVGMAVLRVDIEGGVGGRVESRDEIGGVGTEEAKRKSCSRPLAGFIGP
jgi:hypothetical protein